MAAKRKKKKMKKNQVQVPFPVLLANILVLVAVLGLSYMWLCSRCDALGKDIKDKERDLAIALKDRENEQECWTLLTSPDNLEQAIETHGLDMVWPHDKQIVNVSYWYAADNVSLASNK